MSGDQLVNLPGRWRQGIVVALDKQSLRITGSQRRTHKVEARMLPTEPRFVAERCYVERALVACIIILVVDVPHSVQADMPTENTASRQQY